MNEFTVLNNILSLVTGDQSVIINVLTVNQSSFSALSCLRPTQVSLICFIQLINDRLKSSVINLQVGEGLLKLPPPEKMAISALFLVQLSPKIDFFYKLMRMPIIAFKGLEMAKKGFL